MSTPADRETYLDELSRQLTPKEMASLIERLSNEKQAEVILHFSRLAEEDESNARFIGFALEKHPDVIAFLKRIVWAAE